MQQQRKDVMVYHFDPQKRFFIITVTEQNVPGALGALANILGLRGINLLEGWFGGSSEAAQGPVSFFAESTDPRLDREWITEYLKASVYVSDIQVQESKNGFIADTSFPLTWASGDRAVMLRVSMTKTIFNVVRAVPGIGEEVLYRMGFESGKSTWQDLFARLHPATKEALADNLGIYAAVGWGRPELVELDQVGRRARIAFAEGFECEGTATGKPYSHFTRGHLAGAISAYFKADLKCVETRCVSAAARYCEFLVSP
ncbi:MAG TPA: V4R domain-containing protein [Nitrososphaerales archaeon]|nr:V4R domain-containing protein [Nitrososphaerales archaeon]